ncbi:hypothetical protein [Burkholderia ubonensis]|uniref:hypothetical protein n=1 Tax=Burkholderia ubonensis TaxID=101571 RepID=UPI000AF656F7|nr:hypothetical protein [Burkholderia ubonensis]
MFFEAPSSASAAAHLEQLLAAAWGVDTRDWTARGFICNLFDARELVECAYGRRRPVRDAACRRAITRVARDRRADVRDGARCAGGLTASEP